MPTSAILVYGNTDLWAAAAIALATRFGWPAILLTMKPILFPIALLWVTSVRWWISLGVLTLLSVPLGGLWADWVMAIMNVESTLTRNVNSIPFLAIPLIVFIARTRDAGSRSVASPDTAPADVLGG